MKKHKIKEAFTIKEGRTTYYYYRISDIEQGIYNSGKYIDFITNDVGLAKKNGKIILKKHEMLI